MIAFLTVSLTALGSSSGATQPPSSTPESARDGRKEPLNYFQLQADLQKQSVIVDKVCALLAGLTAIRASDFARVAAIAQQGVASETGQTVEQIQQTILAAAEVAAQLMAAARALGADDPANQAEARPVELLASKKIGDAFLAAGRPGEAIEGYRAYSSLIDREQEPERWVSAILALGGALQNFGKYSEAGELYKEAALWAERNPALSTDHPMTLLLLDALATTWWQQGNDAKAEPLFRRSWKTRERLLGPDDPDTLKSACFLARSLRGIGQLAEAEQLLRETLAAREAALAETDPDMLQTVSDLGQLLFEKGDLAGAEPLFRRTLAARQRALGPIHADTLSSMNNLANLLSLRGNVAAAEMLARRALAGRDRTLGPDHPDTLASLGNLACLLTDKSDFEGAEPLFRRALTAQEHNLGPDHPDTLMTVANLAIVMEARGDRAEAEALSRRVLDSRRRTLAPNHPDIARSCYNLSLLLEKKNTRQALALAEESASIARVALPEGQPDRARYESHFAALRKAFGAKPKDSLTPRKNTTPPPKAAPKATPNSATKPAAKSGGATAGFCDSTGLFVSRDSSHVFAALPPLRMTDIFWGTFFGPGGALLG